jgi:hypothetical protein
MADHWRTQHRRDLLAVAWRLPLILAGGLALAVIAAAGLWTLGRWCAELLGIAA